jgi:hypothetical protein
MPKVWPHETIRELIALAEATGESQAELASDRDAELFRFAIYSFRRNMQIGLDLSVIIDNNKVIISKRKLPAVNIVQNLDLDVA